MNKLEIILNEVERNIEFHENVNQNVSRASIGWQLEHLMLVINNVAAAIEKSNPNDYKFKYKPIRFVIMTIKKMPRGKARAPKGVMPNKELTRTSESMQKQLEIARASTQKLYNLDKNQFFVHPYFGNMRRNAAIKFLGIHSNHHLAIVKDILR
ncbi:MAG: hypothetical protein NWQ27_06760 [Crocinitomicaceae bacterium]|jgi:hypothetical protein|nr:hypothetical protein [Crocinitomicaceae bacterium]MDP5099677.1 hypothetical protein [Crocinitomicaceae bacterium]